MDHKTKESGKKGKEKNTTGISPQDVQQERQHPSLQNPEYQAPIPGLDAEGIGPELLPRKLKFFLWQYLFLFFCIMNLTITIFLSLFLPSSLSLLFV
jgi:hypothetical protein